MCSASTIREHGRPASAWSEPRHARRVIPGLLHTRCSPPLLGTGVHDRHARRTTCRRGRRDHGVRDRRLRTSPRPPSPAARSSTVHVGNRSPPAHLGRWWRRPTLRCRSPSRGPQWVASTTSGAASAGVVLLARASGRAVRRHVVARRRIGAASGGRIGGVRRGLEAVGEGVFVGVRGAGCRGRVG